MEVVIVAVQGHDKAECDSGEVVDLIAPKQRGSRDDGEKSRHAVELNHLLPASEPYIVLLQIISLRSP
jgi:hypothetical protein